MLVIAGCPHNRGHPCGSFPSLASPAQGSPRHLRLPLCALFCKVPGEFYHSDDFGDFGDLEEIDDIDEDGLIDNISENFHDSHHTHQHHHHLPDLLAVDLVGELHVGAVEPHPHGQCEQDPRCACSCHLGYLLSAWGEYY